jgi:hypothetical protein
MTRQRKQHVEAPGQDSFLDIVANLVGILIILIMVIGARATNAMVEATPDGVAEDETVKIDLEGARAAAEAVEADVHKVDAKIKRELLEIEYRRRERDKFLQSVTIAEQAMEQQRKQLGQKQQEQLAMRSELLAARGALEDLKHSRIALENALPQQNVIEHLPTPMAKTVFGRELHFRLLGGRLAYVPWDELVERMKADAPQRAWKLKSADRITEVVGPVRGFRMQYTLRHARRVSSVGGGAAVAVQSRIELDRFVLLPVRHDLGEPLEAALQDGAEFRSLISQFDPNRTTVTVWVYPDSFHQFRQVKETLFRMGYLTAGRPMPEGHPIGGSPDGTRSASQ